MTWLPSFVIGVVVGIAVVLGGMVLGFRDHGPGY